MGELHSIHDLGLVGHIEDIAVARDQQGKKLGLSIIQALDHVAEEVGCYKVCFFLFGGLVWEGRGSGFWLMGWIVDSRLLGSE